MILILMHRMGQTLFDTRRLKCWLQFQVNFVPRYLIKIHFNRLVVSPCMHKIQLSEISKCVSTSKKTYCFSFQKVIR